MHPQIAHHVTVKRHSLEIDPIGLRMPSLTLCDLVDDEILAVDTAELVRGARTLLLGVPGAFTPVCTQHHLPEFIANADSLRTAGFSQLICVAPNSPWAVQRWARDIDPDGKIRFLSDGNLCLARKFGLVTRVEDLFLGECSKRFLMTVNDGVIERLRVERLVTDVTCTSTNAALLED
jgi:peroxiredoxin